MARNIGRVDEDEDEDSPSERSSLLPGSDSADSSAEPPLLPVVHSPSLVVALLSVVIFVFIFGSFLMITPYIRVFEDIICHHYYNKIEGDGHVALNGKIDEGLCKGPEIQEELAIIVGGLQFADSVPGLLFAYPWGVLADKIGRKRVLSFAVIGTMLGQAWILMVCWWWRTFPLWLIWLSPVFQVIGGGGTVIQSVVYALISDVSTEANRSNHFFFVLVGSMGGEFLAPSIASAMMLTSPWLPLLVGFGVILVAWAMMVFVPETFRPKPNEAGESTTLSFETSSKSPTVLSKLKSDLLANINALQRTASVPLVLLLLTFLLQLQGQPAVDLIQRYISKRFSWTIAQTGPLISLRALINLILFLAILPFLSHILTSLTKNRYIPRMLRFNFSTKAKDLLLARLSLVLQVFGVLLVGLSAFRSPARDNDSETAFPILLAITGLIIYTLGMGFSALCRSLITTLVDQQHVARLYAVIAVAETIGSLIMAPMLAGLYSWGLRLSSRGKNQGYLGLPFFGLVVLNALAGGGIMWVRIPKKVHSGSEEREADSTNEELGSSASE